MSNQTKKGFETTAIHFGYTKDPSTGSLMPPLFLSTTFTQKSPGKSIKYDYSRAANPSRDYYETCMAELEGGKAGFAFSSGCAATSSVLQLFDSGSHVIAFDDMYGGTFRLFDTVFKRHGFEFSFVDLSRVSHFEKVIQKNKTKLVWLETPTNPTLKVADIQTLCKIAHENNILVAVDNTFLSPYFQKPLSLGADFVIHSATKYLNGHSDVVGGIVIVKDLKIKERMAHIIKTVGAIASPFDSYLVLRSLKTLALRMERHQENALEIAKFLEAHPQVERVLYPGLPSHPQYELSQRQTTGSGGIITFFLKGNLKKVRAFLENLKIFSLAESLGGVESLACHPALMTHASLPPENRKKLGITDQLIRLSIGLESKKDLIEDLKTAL